jgi:intracellular sulfur oxidation DsrE/DsrF family protein
MKIANLLNTLLVPLVALLCAGSLTACATQPKSSGQAVQTVIFQVSDNDPAKWNLALNNALNILKGLPGEPTDIELVAFGPGINMLKMDSSVAGRVMDAMQKGIHIEACQNTMSNMKLTPDDMIGNIGYVPSGVVELMKKQHQGYAYIRP